MSQYKSMHSTSSSSSLPTLSPRSSSSIIIISIRWRSIMITQWPSWALCRGSRGRTVVERAHLYDHGHDDNDDDDHDDDSASKMIMTVTSQNGERVEAVTKSLIRRNQKLEQKWWCIVWGIGSNAMHWRRKGGRWEMQMGCNWGRIWSSFAKVRKL